MDENRGGRNKRREFFGCSVRKGGEKIGKCCKHSVRVVLLSAVLSPQPTSLEQKSVSNTTTDTGELSNQRSPPKEQDGAGD
jgi:hypothetical protein